MRNGFLSFHSDRLNHQSKRLLLVFLDGLFLRRLALTLNWAYAFRSIWKSQSFFVRWSRGFQFLLSSDQGRLAFVCHVVFVEMSGHNVGFSDDFFWVFEDLPSRFDSWKDCMGDVLIGSLASEHLWRSRVIGVFRLIEIVHGAFVRVFWLGPLALLCFGLLFQLSSFEDFRVWLDFRNLKGNWFSLHDLVSGPLSVMFAVI